MVEDLGGIVHPQSWASDSDLKTSWNLTSMLVEVMRINGAPLFDLAVQVDDRNASQYVLSLSLPRQSGVLPQFHSPSSQVLPLESSSSFSFLPSSAL